MFKRPTTMANAFITATVKQIKAGKVDHVKGTGNWVARHVAVSAEERPTFGLVTEFDKRPPPPIRTVPMSQKRTASVMSASLNKAITEGIEEVMLKLDSGRKALLMDEEILGVD